MRTHTARLGAFCTSFMVIAAAQSALAAPTLTLKAIKKNGTNITPTTTVTGAVVGDIYDAEIYISGWQTAPPLVRGYQLRLLGLAGTNSGGSPGGILPVGWDAPIEPQICSIPSDCNIPAYPICQAGGRCVGAAHNPTQGASISTSNPNFILFDFTSAQGGGGVNGGVNLNSLDLLYAMTANDTDGASDTGAEKYAGTLRLQVKPDACGTYTFSFDPALDKSFLLDASQFLESWPIAVVNPLTISISGGCPLEIVSTTPPVCTIDARYPHSPENASPRLGFNNIVMTFNRDPGALTCSSFTLSTLPTGPGAVSCSSVVCNAALKQCTMTFNLAIQTSKWTCVQLNPVATGDKVCIASLPADADSSRLSEGADANAIMDHLDGEVTLDIWECDIDRSTRCAPLDVIAAIDLLNGAGAFQPFRAVSIPACPASGVPIP